MYSYKKLLLTILVISYISDIKCFEIGNKKLRMQLSFEFKMNRKIKNVDFSTI